MLKIIILFILFLNSKSCFTEEEYFERGWLRLLHYQKNLFGGYKSQIDNSEFFLSKDGAIDPSNEFKKSVLKFNQSPDLHCKFPARFEYLKRKGKIYEIKRDECQKLKKWMNLIDPASVVLTYASSFPNNPVSTFGHTFLRIISKKNKRSRNGKRVGSDILDFAISYSAITDDSPGLIYAYKGLLGGYRGQFTISPYYMKIKEYNNIENRDLWEYELNISESQTRKMLLHLYELERIGYFDYYFLDENCSYHILGLLEIAREDWDLTSGLNYVTPVETIKRVAKEEGSIAEVRLRRSLHQQAYDKFRYLNKDEKEEYDKTLKDNMKVKDNNSYRVLDALATRVHYTKIKKRDKDSDINRLFDEILLQLSKTKMEKEFVESIMFKENRPDYSHNSRGISIGGGVDQDNNFMNISFRLGLHDLLNRSIGFSRKFRIKFLKFNLRYQKIKSDKELYLKEITIIDILSLVPISEFEKQISWGFDLKFQNPLDQNNKKFLSPLLEPKLGASFYLFNRKLINYNLIKAGIEYGTRFNKSIRFNPSFKMGFLLNGFKIYKADLSYQYLGFLEKTRLSKWYNVFSLEQSLILSKNSDLRVKTTQYSRTDNRTRNYFEYLTRISLYF